MAGAREHEVRITGLTLAVLGLLCAVTAIWIGVSFSEKFRSQATNARVPSASISL